MSKFKKYLNEGRTKKINGEKAVDLIIKNASKNFKSIYMTGKVMPIYRGLPDKTEFGYIDTNKGELRIYANTYNYMTLLMDNLSSWKKYPKRSRGIICSTDPDYASDFAGWGDINHVIPYDNVKIAVEETGTEVEIEKITEISEIINFGVMMTPALAVDGEIKFVGKVASVKEIIAVINIQ